MSADNAAAVLRRLDRAFVPGVVVLLVAGGFVLSRFSHRDRDPSRFVVAGDRFCDPTQTPDDLAVKRDSAGYDGQFYYRLALDPFSATAKRYGIRLDEPPYRQQRIVYPLLVWLLSAGRPGLALWMMILVNIAGLGAIGWIGGAIARSLGRHALWGLLLAAHPGFVLTLARDLPEIVEVALLLAGVLALFRGRPILASLALTLGVLAKETALLLPVALLIAFVLDVLRRRSRRPLAWLPGALPLAVYGVCQAFLALRWGVAPVVRGGGNIGSPLAGLVPFVRDVFGTRSPVTDLWGIELCFLAIFAAGVFWTLRTTRTPPAMRIAWGLYGLLALVLTRMVWCEDWAFLRAISEFYCLGTIALLGTRWRLLPWLTGYIGLVWLIVMRTRA